MTCLYVGHPHRRHYVEQAIRVHQNNDNAVLLGIALSDLLERVLLMDKPDASSETQPSSSETTQSPTPPPDSATRPATSLRDALDMTLNNIKEEHGDGWFHFADAWTAHHQQQEKLLESWNQAKQTAENKKSIGKVADVVGNSCHMPGALVVSLHALYRAANAETKTAASSKTKKKASAVTTHHMGYDYFVKTILGITSAPAKVELQEENPLLVAAIRGNILAAGDTCSRAIFIGKC